mgnify:FL=1
MNKFKVKVIKTDGEVIDTVVEGTDGPEFNGDNGMYKLLGVKYIEITGARYNDKNYDLYIDEEGRMSDLPTLNHKATEYFLDWLDHEGRMTMIPNVVGNAALVDMEPIDEW